MKKYQVLMIVINQMATEDIVRTSVAVMGDDTVSDAFGEADNPGMFLG